MVQGRGHGRNSCNPSKTQPTGRTEEEGRWQVGSAAARKCQPWRVGSTGRRLHPHIQTARSERRGVPRTRRSSQPLLMMRAGSRECKRSTPAVTRTLAGELARSPRHPRARRDLRSRQTTARRRPRPRAHAVGAVVFLGHRNVYWVRGGRRTNRHRSRSGSHAATDRPEREDDRGVGLAWPAWPPGRRLGPLRHALHRGGLSRTPSGFSPRPSGGRPRTCRVSLTPPCGRGLLRRGRRGVEPGAGTFDPRRTLPRRGLQPSWNRMRTGKPQREETPWRTDGAG